ncbi:MAG: hypothetical protein WC524_09340 [Candidatus Aminicenantales bacterium]
MAAPNYPSPFAIYDEHFYQLSYDPDHNAWMVNACGSSFSCRP